MFIFVYITNPSEEVAEQIARSLLQQRLIACANLLPIKSMYHWEGNIENSQEVVLIAKTTEDHYPSICRWIAEQHPYQVPCVARLPVELNTPFGQWIQAQTHQTT